MCPFSEEDDKISNNFRRPNLMGKYIMFTVYKTHYVKESQFSINISIDSMKFQWKC